MDLQNRIAALSPVFEEILAISGSPGLSLGVLHHGEIISTKHFGRRDIAKSAPPDDDTIYHVASVTKSMTAAVVGILVDEGLLGWDIPIRKYLPAFRSRADAIGMQATLRDLLSNRTGLAVSNATWGQMYGEFLMPRHEMIRMATYIEAVRPFRKNFVYSSWNWGLIQEVIEAVAGKSLDSVVKEKITQPLAMQRTTSKWLESDQDSNIALAHAVKNDSTPIRILFPNLSDSTGHAAAAGAKSTIRDLLSLYKSLLKALAHQKTSHATRTPGTPFVQLETIFSPQIAVSSAAPIDQTAYCLGVYRTKTPGNLGVASMNTPLLGGPKNVPRIGRSKPGVEIFGHTGTIPGFLASYFLIPSTESAVVVLTNSLPLMDPTDAVGQMLVALLLGEDPPENYPSLAESAAFASIGAYMMLADAVAEDKTEVPPSLPLDAYVGEYWNTANNYVLTITREGDGLRMVPQRAAHTYHNLQPYDGETFYWQVDREDELCKKGMWPFISAAWHKVTFGLSVDGLQVVSLTWHHDPLGKPEVFRIKGPESKL